MAAQARSGNRGAFSPAWLSWPPLRPRWLGSSRRCGRPSFPPGALDAPAARGTPTGQAARNPRARRRRRSAATPTADRPAPRPCHAGSQRVRRRDPGTQDCRFVLNIFRNKRTNIVFSILLVMLIVGLAGFGIGVGGGISTSVARVGDQEVAADAYARALDQELRSLSGQIGRQLTIEEARAVRHRPHGAGAAGQRRRARRRGGPAAGSPPATRRCANRSWRCRPSRGSTAASTARPTTSRSTGSG